MTRILVVLLAFLGFTWSVQAQNLLELGTLSPTDDYENVHVQKIADGPEASSFVIWIKHGVKAHYHADHAEHIYILAGTASMRLNDDTFTVEAGDFVRIPKASIHAVTVTSEVPLQVLSIQTPQFLGSDRIWVEE